MGGLRTWRCAGFFKAGDRLRRHAVRSADFARSSFESMMFTMTHLAFGTRHCEPAFALCGVVMLLLSSCIGTPPPPTSTPGAAIPKASPKASPDPSPAAVVVAAPATIPLLGPLPDVGYEAFPTGALTGEWAYTVDASDQVARLWAVPLDGRPAKLAVRFRGAASSLGSQFAPDGKRVLLVVDTPRPSGGSRASLVLVELEIGRASPLGRDDGDSDRSPAWSPDGQYVAYRRELDRRTTSALDDGIWLMRSDGRDVRQLIPGRSGEATRLFGWTANGSHVAFAYSMERAYTLVDLSSGVPLRVGSGYVANADERSFASRSAAPGFAGVFVEQTGCVPRYLGVSDGRGDFAILRREPVQGCLASLRNVRWHPREDALLYFRDDVTAEVHIVNLAGNDQSVPISRRPTFAEWTADGGRIVYAALSEGQCCFATDLRIVNRDGSGERAIFTLEPRALLIDLALRTYR